VLVASAGTVTEVLEMGIEMIVLEADGVDVVRPPAADTADTAETRVEVGKTELHFFFVLVEVMVVVDEDVVVSAEDGGDADGVTEAADTILVSAELPPGMEAVVEKIGEAVVTGISGTGVELLTTGATDVVAGASGV